jgi:hypothetical protein
MVNSRIDRLVLNCILKNWVFSATMVHTNAEYEITLLGLVFQSVCFIWVGGAGRPAKLRAGGTTSRELSEEVHCIGLLLPPQLLEVLVCTHAPATSVQSSPGTCSTNFCWTNEQS